MIKKLVLTITIICSVIAANYNQPTTEQMNQILDAAMKHVWQEAMNAKAKVNAALPQTREELLENLCSSAPSVNFVTHADLSDSLTSSNNTSASIFVSTDNQNSWIENPDLGPVDAPGYETTWGTTTITDGGNSVSWYLSGSVDSGSLGLDLGQVTVSQSPYNVNDTGLLLVIYMPF